MTDFMKSKHVVPLIGGGKQPLQVIAVYDLVRVIKTLLTKHHSGTFVVATPEVYTYKTFWQKISRKLGIKVLFVPVPLGLLLGATKVTAALHLPLSLNSDNVLGLKHLMSMETAADLKKLGIKLDNLDQILDKPNFIA
jgi:nucleoside-diphosphate-sugar epimerase